MRIVALLLAIVMMAGTATQVCAARDLAGAIDETPDLAVPNLAEPVAVARPDHRPIASIEAPDSPPGRAHAVLIFRPPR